MFKKQKNNKHIEIENIESSISGALNIGFNLYDSANKEAIKQLTTKESVSPEDIRRILWHIQNEYLDTYKEVMEFREKYGIKFDKNINMFVKIEEE